MKPGRPPGQRGEGDAGATPQGPHHSGEQAAACVSYVPLPPGLANPREEGGAVFDGLARLYDAARPGYPAEALADLGERCRLAPPSRVLEVGCGTGQLTRDLAAVGCRIHCLEPGPALAGLARQNLAGAPHVTVATTTFEAAPDEPGAYDAVVSATAFHWLDPATSFAKAAGLLHPGGSLALLTNAHAAGGTQEQIAGAVQRLHERLVPEMAPWRFPPVHELRRRAGAGGDIAAVWSRVERTLSEPPDVSQLFAPPAVAVYPWLARYDRPGYQAMLASHSSYALMDPDRRRRLLDAIGDLVDEHLGGQVTKQYVTVLATARVA